MPATQDLAAFFQLLHALGVPGIMTLMLLPIAILAMLLFMYIRSDQKKWDNVNTQSDARWEQMLEAHKGERDRDFEHLKELMGNLSGQYQILTTLAGKVDQVDRGTINLGAAMSNLPTLFRDLHSRFDQMIPHLRKEFHVRDPGPQGPSASRQG